jgi:hypothetical protein
MLKPAEIPEFGQKYVEAYLTSTGYHCTTHRGHHGIDIEARGEEENLLVHVITTRASHEPPELIASDSARVLVKAMKTSVTTPGWPPCASTAMANWRVRSSGSR